MSDTDSTIREQLAKPGETAPVAHESSSDAGRSARIIVEFPPTRWTLVLDAAEGDDAKAQQAMAALCELYRSAIQGYFRMKCRDPHAADDLAGAFVLHLLERNRFRKFVKRDKMRFRNYLSRALKYFLCDHLPAAPSEPVDLYLETAGEDSDIDKHIDAQLALAKHHRALAALHENYGRHGKAVRAARLGSFLFEDPEGDEYQRVAADLGLTLNALYQAVFRLRSDYYERFRAEVSQTVGHGKEELDEETRYLMALLPAALGAPGSQG